MQQKGHNQRQQHYHRLTPVNRLVFGLAVVGLIGAAFLLLGNSSSASSLLRYGGAWGCEKGTSVQMEAVLHYATSRVVPQQSVGEISVCFDVLRSMGPTNFLVFGLGHDSLMWAALNPRGETLFLEEDPKWVQTVLKDAPALRAQTVRYRNQLSEADELLQHFRTEPNCSPKKSFLRGNDKCRYFS